MRYVILFSVLWILPAMGFSATLYVPQEYSTIQEAIEAAVNGDIILVDQGTYVENINFKGKAIVVESLHGPEATIIDGNQLVSVVVFVKNEGLDSVLNGFTITNAHGHSGIYCLESSPTLSNNIIMNNINTGYSGGGIFLHKDSSSLIEYNHITQNQAGSGAGIDVGGGCDPIIRYNLIEKNENAQSGGGIHVGSKAQPLIYGNIIQNNKANYVAGRGGGLFLYSATWIHGTYSTVFNNLIRDNYAVLAGGGICIGYESSRIYNNTVIDNQAYLGGGIYVLTFSQLPPEIFNSIVWGNCASLGEQIYLDPAPGSTAKVSFCDVEDGWPGSGNINEDPRFADPLNDDYHLTVHSPCINQGTNQGAPSVDFEGESRPCMGTVDMGLDEFTGMHTLEADVFTLTKDGGVVHFTLHGGIGNENRAYLLLGSVTGTAPGIPLPGGLETLPVNWDLFTDLVVYNLNTPAFQDFWGILDPSGTASARLDTLGPVPSAKGLTLSFAYALNDPWDFVSNPINILIYMHEYKYDDGTTEGMMGWVTGGEMCWMHCFEAEPGYETIDAILTAFGSPLLSGASPGNGTPSRVFLWDDPNNDGEPSDCVLLALKDTTVQNVDTDILNQVVLDSPVQVTGKFFIGCVLDHAPGQYAAPVDSSTTPYNGEAWLAGNPGGVFDYLDLSNNILYEMGNIGYPGYFLLRATAD